jgi:DNA-binding transcriptional LysR family regulator
VSKAIARLERELGVRLLQRTTRNLGLTPDGQVFYERCSQWLADMEETRALLQDGAAEPVGVLRVSLPITFGRLVVAPLLARLSRRYPGLAIEAGLTDRKVDLIEEGVDVAVRIGELPDNRLIARRISRSQHVVCAAPEFIARHGRPAHPLALPDYPCITFRSLNTHQILAWPVADAQGSSHSITPPGRLVFDHGEAMVEAALAGGGFTCAHRYIVAPLIAQGRLVEVFACHPDDATPIYAVYPSSRHLSPRVRAFVDLLAGEIGEVS